MQNKRAKQEIPDYRNEMPYDASTTHLFVCALSLKEKNAA